MADPTQDNNQKWVDFARAFLRRVVENRDNSKRVAEHIDEAVVQYLLLCGWNEEKLPAGGSLWTSPRTKAGTFVSLGADAAVLVQPLIDRHEKG